MSRFSSRAQTISPKEFSPTIIVGMHRSGTTLVTRLLQKCGLFVGKDVSRGTCESLFFRQINYDILSTTGATWLNPEPHFEAIQHPEFLEICTTQARVGCQTPAMRSYLGSLDYWRGDRLQNLQKPWGWKDPRNTILLSLWQQIYPQARIVHVVRNGVDVAQSLITRDRDASHSLKSRVAQVVRKWSGRDIDTVTGQDFPDFRAAFQLWERYLEIAEGFLPTISPSFRYEIRYEDLLADPLPQVTALCQFLQLPADSQRLTEAAAEVNSSRRFAFAQKTVAPDVQELVAKSDRMRRYGYFKELETAFPIEKMRLAS